MQYSLGVAPITLGVVSTCIITIFVVANLIFIFYLPEMEHTFSFGNKYLNLLLHQKIIDAQNYDLCGWSM